MINPLVEIIEKRKSNINSAIPSYCCANKYVIEAILEQGKRFGDYILIESTSNQVNQFGGYFGMTPKDFREYVQEIAEKVGFDFNKVILGGDHLGPQPWQNLNEKEAMVNSKELVRQCVLSGYTKIHLDTSMRVADDDTTVKLSTAIIARRGAELLMAAEEAFEEVLQKDPEAVHPVYVIGSEVPIPGGSQNETPELEITSPEDFRETVDVYKEVFRDMGLEDKWQHVIAVVVQPGVEFGDDEVDHYDRMKARFLVAELKNYPELVFEGHSTDYQTPRKLKKMAEDGIAILKVGPALTFSLREALFALSYMEKELIPDESKRANFMEVLEAEMLADPKDWIKYYHGNENELKFARKYSFSDRSRYYLSHPNVSEAIEKLITNLEGVRIPLSIIHQYMPMQYVKIRDGVLKNTPRELIKDSIINLVDDYNYATKYNYINKWNF